MKDRETEKTRNVEILLFCFIGGLLRAFITSFTTQFTMLKANLMLARRFSLFSFIVAILKDSLRILHRAISFILFLLIAVSNVQDTTIVQKKRDKVFNLLTFK